MLGMVKDQVAYGLTWLRMGFDCEVRVMPLYLFGLVTVVLGWWKKPIWDA